jgi:hypothetical protein
LSVWPEIIEQGQPTQILLLHTTASKITDILSKTHEIETCPMDKLDSNFTSYMGWLD